MFDWYVNYNQKIFFDCFFKLDLDYKAFICGKAMYDRIYRWDSTLLHAQSLMNGEIYYDFLTV